MSLAGATGAPGDRSGLSRLREVPAYPAVLAVALVLLSLLSSGASPYAALRLFVGFGLGALAATAVSRVVMGDRHRAGVVAMLIVLLVMTGVDRRIAALLAVGLAIVAIERVAGRRLRLAVPWPLAGRIFSFAAAVILLAVVLRAAGDGSLSRAAAALVDERPLFRTTVAAPPTATPDVWLVILDGHARADKLAEVFGHDAQPFLDALALRGLDVASASRSNYLLTDQSLPSLLNMDHLGDLMDRESVIASGYIQEARRILARPAVFDQFHRHGYEVVAISPGFEEVALRGADRFIDTGQANELEIRFMGRTLVAPGLQAIAPDWFADQQRSRVVSVLAAAAAVAREPHERPRFIIVHVPSPHGPIVFAADGTAVPMTDLTNFYSDTFEARPGPREDALAAYAAQVAHVDELVLPALDAILAAPQPPAVLVISDHGSGSNLSWTDLDHSDLDERTANLFAASIPGHPGLFPDDVTLVNVFGRLFEALFDEPFVARPDVAYRWRNGVINLEPITFTSSEAP